MFDAMMRLVTEQQLRDGAVQRKEFETLPAPVGIIDAETRNELVAAILAQVPEHHQFVSARGQKGIVYFDQRGRASSSVIDDLDDEMLAWIASSLKGARMSVSPSTGHGQPPQMAEGSRASVEKKIFAKFPPDSKRKPNLVMLTGSTAKAVGKEEHARVKLSDLTDAEIDALAKVVGVGGVTETRTAIERYEAGEPVRYADLKREGWGSTQEGKGIPPDVARTMETAKANEKAWRAAGMTTFKKGEFWKSKSQGLWFWPTEDLKNGGVKGLQLDLSFSKKPKWKSLTQAEKPRGRNEFWVVATPDDEILSYFRKHDEFKES